MSTRKASAHPHVSKCGRLILLSSHLVRRITSRRKSLGRLREADYKKYEWLLEKLNLLYKPQPHDAPPGQLRERELVARKASIERLTDMWCDELRRHRWGAVTSPSTHHALSANIGLEKTHVLVSMYLYELHCCSFNVFRPMTKGMSHNNCPCNSITIVD